MHMNIIATTIITLVIIIIIISRSIPTEDRVLGKIPQLIEAIKNIVANNVAE